MCVCVCVYVIYRYGWVPVRYIIYGAGGMVSI